MGATTRAARRKVSTSSYARMPAIAQRPVALVTTPRWTGCCKLTSYAVVVLVFASWMTAAHRTPQTWGPCYAMPGARARLSSRDVGTTCVAECSSTRRVARSVRRAYVCSRRSARMWVVRPGERATMTPLATISPEVVFSMTRKAAQARIAAVSHRTSQSPRREPVIRLASAPRSSLSAMTWLTRGHSSQDRAAPQALASASMANHLLSRPYSA
mmetsp:Transcript_30158/g.86868  ORF Transcript_30158/g.86868 Transcript_30158/m.86868 type:complete len:214 (+) Transcript_30158:188-829(+)